MKSIIILTLGVLVFLCSCVKEDMIRQDNAPEGEPALVSLKMNMATMGSSEKTRAMTPDQEKEIVDLRVLIFDNADKIVTNRKYVGSATSINVETYSGNNRNIYVVANAVEAVDKRLCAVTTKAEFLAVQTTDIEMGFGLNVDKPLMMTGVVENVNIQPREAGTNTIPPIQLHFLAAKLTLIVKDATTGMDESVTLLGWDVVDVAKNTFVYPGSNDANSALVTNDDAWLTTSGSYPFATDKADPKTGSLEIYLTENRRGTRVDRALPTDPAKRYKDMSVTDGDHRGKAWYKPARATAVLIRAMHKTATETKQINAWIYLGSNNHSNYDLERGNHYTFTVTVNGLNDINVDTNVDYAVGDFAVDYGTNLTMDAHPDFRPMRIHAPKGKATIEIVDDAGRTFNEPGFSATWLKISPLNLMYHQVKQSPPNDEWQQQAGTVGSFVRAKYIPHKSVRALFAGKGGWNQVPAGKEDDDVMTFDDATYRMCYKIMDIPFEDIAAVTNKTLCVYADEFLSNGGSRTAKVRVTYYKDNGDINNPEVRSYDVSQNGYISVYDNSISDAGLLAQNEDGTPGIGTPKKFVIEQTEEVALAMNPGIDPNVQMTTWMQWGFSAIELYGKEDKYRYGFYLTANAVYNDVSRTVDNEPTGFGTTSNSYRPMYSNGLAGSGPGVIPSYTGSTTGPYYYPKATDLIYHPIYKSSAARYCHEKNRDMNGDGIIDVSETKWYFPSQHELLIIWIAGKQSALSATDYLSSTELDNSGKWTVNFASGDTKFSNKIGAQSVHCVRRI